MTIDEHVSNQPRHVLRLFVAGTTIRSQQAIKNLRHICAEQLEGEVDLEVIDIYQQPELAAQHQIIAAPTLLRLLPLPVRRIIGDLSQTQKVLEGLDLIAARPRTDDTL